MPYIDEAGRRRIDRGFLPNDKGELTFVIYRILRQYGATTYQDHSDAVAAANDAAHEYRRRILDPYEDEKMRANGDVF